MMLVLFGAGGALLAELVNMRGIRENSPRRWNAEKGTFDFWAIVVAFSGAGGFVAWAEGYSTGLSAIVAVNVGFTWPLLLRRGVQALPEPDDLGPTD